MPWLLATLALDQLLRTPHCRHLGSTSVVPSTATASKGHASRNESLHFAALDSLGCVCNTCVSGDSWSELSSSHGWCSAWLTADRV